MEATAPNPPITGTKRVPPVEHRFKPGNPGGPGRPKGTSLTDRLRACLDEIEDPESGKTVAEGLIETARKAARAGDVRFWQLIIDRVDGPLKQQVEAAVTHTVVHVIDVPATPREVVEQAAAGPKLEAERAD